MMKLLIKNGRVIDPRNGIDDLLDILIERGKIKGIAPQLEQEHVITIDATNKVVTPGLIDMHVHFRQPGLHEYKETIRTGSHAAAKGGFTTVVCEPNTKPPIDDSDYRVKYMLDVAKNEGLVHIYTKACMTKGMLGKELVDVKKVIEQGAVAITDDGYPVNDIDLIVAAGKEAKKYGIPMCPHCEESRPQNGRKEAFAFTYYSSEAKYIQQYIIHGVKDTLCACHFPHVSLQESVERIRQAKEEGLPVTAEATPHHLTLTREDAERIGPNAKVNPPLRETEDVEALKRALKNGIIDVIATDHAPHTPDEKMGENPPFGIIGLETSLGIVLTFLVKPGILTLYSAIEKMTVNPTKILKIKGGDLRIGSTADITIIDPSKEWTVDANEFESKGRNCPFIGWKLTGKALMTIVDGKVVMSDGEIFDPPSENPFEWQPNLKNQLKFSI
jgi:dihydroorotase